MIASLLKLIFIVALSGPGKEPVKTNPECNTKEYKVECTGDLELALSMTPIGVK